jgi:hypothetical protein
MFLAQLGSTGFVSSNASEQNARSEDAQKKKAGCLAGLAASAVRRA